MRVDADDFARPSSCGREHQIAVKDFDRSRSSREA